MMTKHNEQFNGQDGLTVSHLKVNNLTSPMGIDSAVRFSWHCYGSGYGKAQSAYRILVSSSWERANALTGDVWDSGKTTGEYNYDISYLGAPLASRTVYYYRIAVWDEKDVEGPFSEIATFETGILEQNEWQGIWIGARRDGDEKQSAPLLRKTFSVKSGLVSARAYIAGLGLYEMEINHIPADDTVLNPAHTQYEDTVHYRVYDLTDKLTVGKNVITVELGDGFYHNDVGVWNWQNAVWRDLPKLRAMVYLSYADGTVETVVSDKSWKIRTDGPTLVNNILLGDLYDARREQDGWQLSDFDDSAWENASAVLPPAGKLMYGAMEPMRRLKRFVPTVTSLQRGVYLIENPEMATGWAEIRLNAPVGEEITITYGETLQAGGFLKKPTDFGISFQIDRYIANGVQGEIYRPKFSYKGYRYVQVENYSGTLTSEDVTCYLIANDVTPVSTLETGNDLINRLHGAMHRTIRNNLQGKPTDTPIWEKNGWTGDFHVSLESINYNYDVAAFTMKFLGDLEDAASEQGVVPLIAPTANWGMDNQVVWNGVLINAVYELYRFYGLRSAIRRFYPAMARQVAAYLTDMKDRGWVWRDDQLCDWVSPAGGSDPNAATAAGASEGSGICGTGYVYLILTRMVEMANVLGKDGDAAGYRQAMEKVYAAFNEKYYNNEKGYYETTVWDGSRSRSRYRQTSNLVPLAFGLCPAEHRSGVIESLIQDIRAKGCHLDTGMVGTKLLLPMLTEAGYHDLAYQILISVTYPSWGYWMEWGSDTTWEGYENTARSHNHYFLGTYDEWLYSYLAGIGQITEGFRTVRIFPRIVADVGYTHCTLQTVRGELISNWDLQADGSLAMHLRIPIGTLATVILPCKALSALRMAGLDASSIAASREDGRLKLMLPNGDYTFTIAPDGVVLG